MKNINVLIIDKDVLVRQALARVLHSEPLINIVAVRGSAEDPGRHIASKNPDVLLLDIHSADSGNMTVFKRIREQFPGLPIVVLSPRTKKGALAAIAALRGGAVDVLTKPEYSNSVLFAERHFSKRLVPMVRAAAGLKNSKKIASGSPEPDSGPLDTPVHARLASEKEKDRFVPVNLVTIGGCTGGLKALFSIIPGLPANFSVPVVIVQHLPRIYTSVLADKLDEQSDIIVREAYDGAELEPGTVWVASGGYHSEIHREGNRNVIKSHRGRRERDNRPSIDSLFRSARQLFGAGVLGVILSGTGRDGLIGAEIIRAAGGKIIVQDPETALVPEVPEAILRAGLTDEFYSESELAEKIVKQVKQGRGTLPVRSGKRMAGSSAALRSSGSQKDLFQLL